MHSNNYKNNLTIPNPSIKKFNTISKSNHKKIIKSNNNSISSNKLIKKLIKKPIN
jgi:hypothetical protein